MEEPLVGIISEVEQKKHKLRVLQVERGVCPSQFRACAPLNRITADSQASDEVSYRCDDLKTGRVIVYRAGV